jgi:hypothetical protein
VIKTLISTKNQTLASDKNNRIHQQVSDFDAIDTPNE